MKARYLNERGESLTMVLMAVAISGVVIAAMTTLITNTQKDVRELSQKVGLLNTQNLLLGAMVNADVCRCNFDPAINTTGSNVLTFDSKAVNKDTKLSVNTLFGGCTSGVLSSPMIEVGKPLAAMPALDVDGVQLEDIRATGTEGTYTANLRVYTNNKSQSAIGRRPATVAINFLADVSAPGSAKIKSCIASAAGIAPGAGGSGGGGGTAPCTTKPSGYRSGLSGLPLPHGSFVSQRLNNGCMGEDTWMCFNGKWNYAGGLEFNCVGA